MIQKGLASLFLCALLSLPVLAEPPPAEIVPQPGEQDQQPANFDGTWQGIIKFDKEAFLTDTGTPVDGLPYRIDIHDAVVRVFAQDNGALSEFMSGEFHIAKVMGNATIFGTHFSEVWTETWVFVVTHKDANTLLVNYIRVVNNDDVPLSDINSKFSTRGYGEFKRVSP